MGLIQNLVKGMGENKKELKQKFKDAQQDLKVRTMLEERSKSANQRELERYVKEEEEKSIKEALEKIRKGQRADAWKGKSILKSQKNILHEDMSVLKGNKNMFKQKNVFLDGQSNVPLSKKRLFAGW